MRAGRSRNLLSCTGGSLVVCVIAPEAVYLAADSRYAGVSGTLGDSARKLLACGSSALCGLSGLVRFTRTEYDRGVEQASSETTFELSEIVDGLPCEGGEGEPEVAAGFARGVHRALMPLWERYAIELDEPLGFLRPRVGRRLRLAQLFYVNRPASGRAFLSTIDLEHRLVRTRSGRYDSALEMPVIRPVFHDVVVEPRIFVRGKRSCAQVEPICGPIESDGAAIGVIERIFDSARRGLRCASSVGGPVDVAVIDTAGRRWLRRKALAQDGPGRDADLGVAV
jgi:hypothetical protein